MLISPENNPFQEDNNLLTVENEYWVNLHRDLEKLKQIPEFKRVILEAYFKDRAVNGVSMLSNPSVKANGHRAEIMEDMVAVSNLQYFFIMIDNLGTSPEETEE